MKRGFLKNASLSKVPAKKADDFFFTVSSEGKTPGTRGATSTANATKKPVPNSKLPGHCGMYFIEKNRAESLAANGSIMYTIPGVPKDATQAIHLGGWSECLTTPAVEKQILSTPGFPQPIRLPSENSYRIGGIPGRVTAVIATRDLEVGDLIISERPILVVPRAFMPCSFDFPKGFTAAQKQQRTLDDFEKQLEALLGRVGEGTREAFLGLQNSYKHDGSGRIFGIMKTNAFALEGIMDEEFGPEYGQYTGAFRDASHLTHSCCPNTNHVFDLASFSMQIYAIRDIKIGEEITSYYNNPSSNAADRQKKLARYGFQCTCPACLNPSDSDPKRKKVFDATTPDSLRLADWSLNPSLPDTYLIKKSLDQIKLAQEQGLGMCMVGPLHTLTQVYICLADEVNSLRYGTLLQKTLLADTGKAIEYYADVEYYRSLATWGLRKRLKPGMHMSNTPVPFLVGDGELGVLFLGEPGGEGLALDGMKRVVDMTRFWQGKGAKYFTGLKPAPVTRGGNLVNVPKHMTGLASIEDMHKQMGMGV